MTELPQKTKASPQWIALIVLAVIIAIAVSYIAYNQWQMTKALSEPSKTTDFSPLYGNAQTTKSTPAPSSDYFGDYYKDDSTSITLRNGVVDYSSANAPPWNGKCTVNGKSLTIVINGGSFKGTHNFEFRDNGTPERKDDSLYDFATGDVYRWRS